MHSKSTIEGKIDTVEIKTRYNMAVKAQIYSLASKTPQNSCIYSRRTESRPRAVSEIALSTGLEYGIDVDSRSSRRG
jgi:hypothetical protein